MIGLNPEEKQLFLQSGVRKNWNISVYDGDDLLGIIPTTNMVDDSITLKETLCSSQSLTYGACEAATFSIKLANIDITKLKDKKIVVKVNAVSDDTQIELDMGTFYVDETPHENNTWFYSLIAYDSMVLFDVNVYSWYTGLTFPMTLQQFRTSLCEYIGVDTAADQSLPLDDMILTRGTTDVNITGRSVLGAICELNSVFGHINRHGELVFLSLGEIPVIELQQGGEDHYKPGSTYENWSVPAYDAAIACSLENSDGVTYPESGGANALMLSDNFLAYDFGEQELARVAGNMYRTVEGVSYTAHETVIRGRPWLEVGDKITIDTDNGPIDTYILERTLTGFQIMEDKLSAKAAQQGDEDRTSTQQQIERLKRDSEQMKVDYLRADVAEITFATIENLNATNATVQSLEAANVVISGQLTAAQADIESLSAEKADITDLNALTARIGTLDADVADINTLIFGSATGTSIQTSFANAVIAQLGDAQIKNAMIESIVADKITAGNIYTNAVRIYGDKTNKLSIVDNTISISDGTQVRVQIGKDASDDYNIYVWNAQGDLMFDALGVTYDGITRPIIRNDIVSDDANIAAYKLDIDSLFSVINEDGSHTLNASKIYIDSEKQTLEVAFNSLTTLMASYGDTITSYGTALSVIQGQIESKIWQQDITNATNVLNQTIQTQYSTFTQSLNELSIQLGNEITNLQGQIDGAYSTWTGEDVPTLNNYPAADWVKSGTLQDHVGNMYYDENGYSYRFMSRGLYSENGVLLTDEGLALSHYYWLPITDSEATKALQDAAKALENVANLQNTLFTNYSTTEQMHTAIDVAIDSITLEVSKTYATHAEVVAQGESTLQSANSYADKAGASAADEAKGYTNTKLADYSTTKEVQSLIKQTADGINLSVSNVKTELIEYSKGVANSAQAAANSYTDSRLTSYSTTAATQSMIDQRADRIEQSVSETYTTKAEYEEFEVGARNLILNSIDLVGKTHYVYAYRLVDNGIQLTAGGQWLVE